MFKAHGWTAQPGYGLLVQEADMSLIAFDTLEYAQSPQLAGIPQEDAEAFAGAIGAFFLKS